MTALVTRGCTAGTRRSGRSRKLSGAPPGWCRALQRFAVKAPGVAEDHRPAVVDEEALQRSNFNELRHARPRTRCRTSPHPDIRAREAEDVAEIEARAERCRALLGPLPQKVKP